MYLQQYRTMWPTSGGDKHRKKTTGIKKRATEWAGKIIWRENENGQMRNDRERERERKRKKGKEGEGDQWNSQVKKHLNMHRIRALWILMVSKESENIYCRVICLRICFNFILLSLFILLFALSLFLPLSLLLYVSFYVCCVLLISLLFSFSKNLKGVQARQRWLSQIERTLSMNTLQSYSKTKRKKRK